jgi:hypothetical protein
MFKKEKSLFIGDKIMKTNILFQKFLMIICLSVMAVGLIHAAETEPPTIFQWLKLTPGSETGRLEAVAGAVEFQKWPQTEVRYLAPSVGKSLLLKPDLVNHEFTSYGIIQFGSDYWGQRRLKCRRLVENRLEGEMFVRISLAPNSRAAQEYMLNVMTANAMSTEGLVSIYSTAEQPQSLGSVSYLVGSQAKNDVCVLFVRANLCISIRGNGCFADEALPLARKIDYALVSQSPLGYQQLIARRPNVAIGSKAPDENTIPYDVSVPHKQKIVRVSAPLDGQNAANKDGTISLRGKTGSVSVKLIAVTDELLANFSEKELTIYE